MARQEQGPADRRDGGGTAVASAEGGSAPGELRRTALSTVALGALMLVVGLVTLTQAVALDNGGAVVGPATAPFLVGGLTLLVGALLVVQGRRDLAGAGREGAGGERHEPAQDWARLGGLVGVLVLFAVIVPLVGYVVSATALFAATAIVLGMPERLRAVAYGFSVATAVFLVFDVGIGISLPTGPWGF